MEIKLNTPLAKATGPLNLLAGTAKPTGTGPLSEALSESHPVAMTNIADQGLFQAKQSIQLAQPIVQFADTPSPPTLQDAAQPSAQSTSGANLENGTRLFEDFFSRRNHEFKNDMSEVETQPLDYAFARMAEQTDAGSLFKLGDQLKELNGKLPCFNPQAQRLSIADVTKYNNMLKEYGLMTDGNKLYNLSVHSASSADGKSSALVACSAADLQKLQDFSWVAAMRNDGESPLSSAMQTPIKPTWDGKPKPFSLDQNAHGIFQSGVQNTPHFGLDPQGTSKIHLNVDAKIGIPQAALNGSNALSVVSAIGNHALIKGIVAASTNTVTENIRLTEDLISQLGVVDQSIASETTQNEVLQGRLGQETTTLTVLNNSAGCFLGDADPAQAIAADPNAAAVTAALNSIGIHIERDENGVTHYYRSVPQTPVDEPVIAQSYPTRRRPNKPEPEMREVPLGKPQQPTMVEITLPEFRIAVAEGIAAQTVKVEGLKSELVQSDTRLRDLQHRSADLSHKLTQASQGLDAELNKLPSTREQLISHYQQLQAIRSDADAWAKLSQQDRERVEQMLKETEQALQQLDVLRQHGQSVIAGAHQQLTQSEQIRQRATKVLSGSEALQQKVALLLAETGKLLEKYKAFLGNASQGAQASQSLIEMADQLAGQLTLMPGPSTSELRKMSDDWLAQLEKTALNFQHLHKSQLSNHEISQQNIERVARTLRDSLNYQAQKLNSMADHGREMIVQALQASLHAIKSLELPSN